MSNGKVRHTVVALLQDHPGSLNRVVSLFRRRGFNIESLAVGHTEQPSVSRMTLVVGGENPQVEQVVKQLYKVVDVLKVNDVTEETAVIRELALIKVSANATTRPEILQLASIFRGDIVDVAPDSLIIELTGTEDKVDAFVELLRRFGIKEMVRTGRVAIVRGLAGASRVEANGRKSG